MSEVLSTFLYDAFVCFLFVFYLKKSTTMSNKKIEKCKKEEDSIRSCHIVG